ncbi:MAG TPA: POTRA domain-containing protein [Pyrinomonadaceae bacterium]|jgi:outer membrane protein insertion porin family
MRRIFLTLAPLLLLTAGAAGAPSREAWHPPFIYLQAPAAPAAKELRIKSIKFEGLGQIPEADILRAFRDKQIGGTKELPLDESRVPDAVEVVRQVLAGLGYLNATVDAREAELSSTAKEVTFIVGAGERLRVAEIQFQGNKIFSTEQLRAEATQCLDHYTQGFYDRRVFDECRRRLDFFMRSQGYLQARVDEPQLDLSEGILKVMVPVSEGSRYRLGQLGVEGSKLFSPAQVLEILDLKPGDIADGEKIGRGLYERLKTLYANSGYLHYTAEPEPLFRGGLEGAGDALVDFRFTIDEGPQFTVRAISFQDNRRAEDEELRRALLIREGDTYNQQLLSESIENLNRLGFELDRERDVDFVMQEGSSQLGIVIHLERKNREPAAEQSVKGTAAQ